MLKLLDSNGENFGLLECKWEIPVDTLSVAYGAVGKFSEAIETAQKALVLAQASGDDYAQKEISKHLELYKAGRPYWEELATPGQ